MENSNIETDCNNLIILLNNVPVIPSYIIARQVNVMQRGMLGTRRNGMEILVNILHEARSGITKTRLVYRTNMNFFAIRRHIDFLTQKGLLTLEYKPFPLYTTTQKGIEFLNEFDKIKETLGIEDDEIHYDF